MPITLISGNNCVVTLKGHDDDSDEIFDKAICDDDHDHDRVKYNDKVVSKDSNDLVRLFAVETLINLSFDDESRPSIWRQCGEAIGLITLLESVRGHTQLEDAIVALLTNLCRCSNIDHPLRELSQGGLVSLLCDIISRLWLEKPNFCEGSLTLLALLVSTEKEAKGHAIMLLGGIESIVAVFKRSAAIQQCLIARLASALANGNEEIKGGLVKGGIVDPFLQCLLQSDLDFLDCKPHTEDTLDESNTVMEVLRALVNLSSNHAGNKIILLGNRAILDVLVRLCKLGTSIQAEYSLWLLSSLSLHKGYPFCPVPEMNQPGPESSPEPEP